MNPRSRSLKIGAVGIAAALSLTLAACGSDSEGASDSSATTAASAEETSTTVAADETTEAPATDAGTIVDIAAGNDDFSTLVAAVQAADLVDTLSGDGPFTVFAPTNEAFAALPDGTLDTLLMPENKDQLAGILTYHVVAGKVMAADLSDGQEVETVNGEMLTVGIDGEKVTLTDAAGNTVNVVDTDIEASNGVIHVIDGVVLPSA
ncbi:MAG: fasciclin domain-containing protein [Acidimicrobiales bacterium]